MKGARSIVGHYLGALGASAAAVGIAVILRRERALFARVSLEGWRTRRGLVILRGSPGSRGRASTSG